jgi:hypothetical protein
VKRVFAKPASARLPYIQGDIVMAAAIAEYRKHQEGGATVFDVTPAMAPKFGSAIGIGIVSVLLGLAFMGDGPGFGIVFLAMGGFAIWYGWTRDIRPKGYKEKSSFRVMSDRIETNGRSFSKDDIHRLLIRNGISDQEVNSGVEMQVSAAQAAGMAYRAKVGGIANALTLESGGKSTILAGGMDSTTAFGLMTDVSKVLGFSYREFS